MTTATWKHAAAGGLIGAMAMTGLRSVTVDVGLLREPPPVEVARHGVPNLLARIPARRRGSAIELAHWSFGIAAALPFAALPSAVRRRPLAGPVYGVAVWAFFETLLGPALGIPRGDGPRVGERAALIAEHALYGALVGASVRRSCA
jgi:hypothetical protein